MERSNSKLHQTHHQSLIQQRRRRLAAASNGSRVSTDPCPPSTQPPSFSSAVDDVDRFSHSRPQWKHSERLRQLGQQSRRSALVASAMGGMVLQGVGFGDGIGDGIGDGVGESRARPKPRFSAAIVTPEKKQKSKEATGRCDDHSNTPETVRSDESRDEAVRAEEFWNFFDAQHFNSIAIVTPENGEKLGGGVKDGRGEEKEEEQEEEEEGVEMDIDQFQFWNQFGGHDRNGKSHTSRSPKKITPLKPSQPQRRPQHAGKQRNQHSLNLPSRNSQGHSASAANTSTSTSTSTEDYRFNFDFGDESCDDDGNGIGYGNDIHNDDGFGDFDSGFAVRRGGFEDFGGKGTTTGDFADDAFADGNERFRPQTIVSSPCWDDVFANNPSFSPASFSDVWNTGMGFGDDNDNGGNKKCDNGDVRGSGWDDIPNWRESNQKEAAADDKINVDDGHGQWLNWEDPFQMTGGEKKRNTCGKTKQQWEDMNSSHLNKVDTSPDRTTVVTSNVYATSSAKSALSLLNDGASNRASGTTASTKPAANRTEIATSHAVDPPSSAFPPTSVKAKAARLDKVARYTTSKNGPNVREAHRTLPPQSSASIPFPRTPQARNITAKRSPSSPSSSAANSTGTVGHKPRVISREEQLRRPKESAISLDKGFSSFASISSSKPRLKRQPPQDQPLFQDSKETRKFDRDQSHHPLPTPSSSNPPIESPIISIHGDSSIFSDSDSIFSNFSHLRQMRMATNAMKNSGVTPARNPNRPKPSPNDAFHNNMSSSANVSSIRDAGVGRFRDAGNFSETKKEHIGTSQIKQKTSNASHNVQSAKSNRSNNASFVDDAHVMLSSTKNQKQLPRLRQQPLSSTHQHVSKAQSSFSNEKNDEKIRKNSPTLPWEGQLFQENRRDCDPSAESHKNSAQKNKEETVARMANLFENAFQEATWSKKAHTDSPVSDSKTWNEKNSSRRRWPPPHPTAPSAPSAVFMSRNHKAPASAIPPPGHHHAQSPTRSDHSADAAAGVKHGMKLRSSMFGSVKNSQTSAELDAGSEATNAGKHHRGNRTNILQSIESSASDKTSNDDSLSSKLDKLSQSTEKESKKGASHHDDGKSLSSSKASGRISLQPSLESECLRQNAAIAVEMDEMMAFFHDHHQDSDSQPYENEIANATDPFFHELLTVSQPDPAPIDPAEVAKDPSLEKITNETMLTSPERVSNNSQHEFIRSPSSMEHEIKLVHPTNASFIPSTIEQTRTPISTLNSNKYPSRSNRSSKRLSADKRHFTSLLSVDEESEFEEPSWNLTPESNNSSTPNKKNPDRKFSEKNELTQFMDTIMRGCYLHDGDNSDVFSYRDDITDANSISSQVDDGNNESKGSSFPDKDEKKPSKQAPKMNVDDSFSRIAQERERIRREDTTPLRTNTSMTKEGIGVNEGKYFNTAKPSRMADFSKLKHVPESASSHEKSGAECNHDTEVLSSAGDLSVQSTTSAHAHSREERSRKMDSTLDEDVLKSYRLTQNSNVLESYRIKDLKMPAISKSTDKDNIDYTNQNIANKLPQLDDKENEQDRDEYSEGHVAKQSIHANERSEVTTFITSNESLHGSDNQSKELTKTGFLETSTAHQATSARMSEREQSQGESLALQSSKRVNADKEFLPNEGLNGGKATLSGRSSLLSMVQHSASVREHFRDNRSNAFHLRNPLYNPDSAFHHTIHEGSHEDSDDDIGIQVDEDDECVPEYQYESFIRDFKDILDNDPIRSQLEVTKTSIEGASNRRGLKNISDISSNDEINTGSTPNKPERPSSVAMTRTIFENQLSANSNATPLEQNQLNQRIHLDFPDRHHMFSSNITTSGHPIKDNSGNLQKTVSSISGVVKRNYGSNEAKVHQHDLPSIEHTKSRLEEKLRGLSNGSEKESGNSIATTDLGSLLTRESEVSHKIVPHCMFHRTHPSSNAATLRQSHSSMQTKFHNTLFATNNEISAKRYPKSFDDLNRNGVTSNRVRMVIPGLSAPMNRSEEGNGTTDTPNFASKTKLSETHRSISSKKRFVGAVAVKNENIESSNAHASAAIARIDEELSEVRTKSSTRISSKSSNSPSPRGFSNELNEVRNNLSKTKNSGTSSPEQRAPLASGKVKKIAVEYERKKVDDFWNQMEKNAKLNQSLVQCNSGVDNIKHIRIKKSVEDESQVSFSEAFEIAPRVQFNAKNGSIRDCRVVNVVNGGLSDDYEKCGVLADSSFEYSNIWGMHDIFESSSHNAFEVAPKEKNHLSHMQRQECESRDIPSNITDKSATQTDNNLITPRGKVKSSPFMKYTWTQRMKKLNNGVPENSKKPSMKPMSFATMGGNGFRKKRAEV